MRVIVIGAGLLGTSTAYFLAERGHEVVVLDRAQNAADETSYANGGIIHASNAAPWNAPGVVGKILRWSGREDAPITVRLSALPGLAGWGLSFLRYSRRGHFERSLRANARLAVYSLSVLHDLRARVDLDYDVGTQGSLMVFRDEGELAAAVREAEILAAAGVRSEPLGRRALATREPTLAGGFAGGLLYPDDESGDACHFARSLATRARELGAKFRLATPVSRLLLNNGAVVGAVTPTGEFRGDACVLAAGSYSPALARPVGLHLPIYPVKGYSLTLPLPSSVPLPSTPLIDGERKVVVAVLGKRLRVAGFAEFAGYDRRTDVRRSAALLRGLHALLPELAASINPADAEPWAGLRPTTTDGRPLLGPTPIASLFLATGTGHLGWTFAAGAGRLVADAITGAPPALDLDELGYRRLVT